MSYLKGDIALQLGQTWAVEPENYDVASKQEVWVKAMSNEIKMIEGNNTWEFVDCPHMEKISLKLNGSIRQS
jgi:hypothetical protein